ncbi:MAG: hypothetical protein ACRC1T_09240 [Clostridium chrysemydis]|uniref:hypothetical protein n=1 Tax=Clostridium chrysemydis TaxID=2665504 RepID=UPI003F375548
MEKIERVSKNIVVDKMKISFFMVLFFLAVMVSSVKPNINYATPEHIAQNVKGIGKSKSIDIVEERKNGLFKDKDDFYIRVVKNKDYKVGDIVYARIIKKYKIGE